MATKISDKIKIIKNNGKINRNHLSNGIRHMANIATIPPKDGLMRLETPSPIWNARMVDCLVMPMTSPTGIITGSVAKA